MSQAEQDGTFILKLEQAEDLPVLPQVHAQALRLAHSPDSNIGQLKDILKYDPALTASILKVANSAYYGFSHKIESLQTALVMLGMAEVTRLVIGSAVVHIFPETQISQRFDTEVFWRHSAAVGLVGAMMVNKLKLATNGDVFTGGLLHDLGRVLLAAHFPTEYERCLNQAEKENIPARVAERQVLGIDHSAIGGYLATRWELPEALTSMIRYHHSPKLDHYHAIDVATVHLANRLVKEQGISLHKEPGDGEQEPLKEDPAWNVIVGQYWPGTLDVAKLMDGAKDEIERADHFISSLIQNT
jgi:HD-like signal output (HDOD) protein